MKIATEAMKQAIERGLIRSCTGIKLPLPLEYEPLPVGYGFTVTIAGLKLTSEANQREHWGKKYTRKKRQQATIRQTFGGIPKPPPRGILGVAFTRLLAGRDKRMDPDNLAGCFKHVQDEIARWMKRDDGDPTVEWKYSQERADKSGLRILVQEL